MKRELTPERLDHLPADDPLAVGSRRDLVRLNRIMGHVGIFAEVLRGSPMPACLTEIGAGDGRFVLRLFRRLGWRTRTGRLTLVDRAPAVDRRTLAGLKEMGWAVSLRTMDVFEWIADSSEDCELCLANLFVHHFEGEELNELLSGIARRCPRFLACEPARVAGALWAARLVGLIGCNSVTRHDAVASVRAGFLAGELSSAWPGAEEWELSDTRKGLFSHLFSAQHGDGVTRR